MCRRARWRAATAWLGTGTRRLVLGWSRAASPVNRHHRLRRALMHAQCGAVECRLRFGTWRARRALPGRSCRRGLPRRDRHIGPSGNRQPGHYWSRRPSQHGLAGSHRQCASGRKAVLGLFCHAPGDHGVQRWRHTLGDAAGRHGSGGEVGIQQRGQVNRVIEGCRAGQALVQHTSQGVDIGPAVNSAASEPLWGHVVRRSGRCPGACQRCLSTADRLGYTEVDHVNEVAQLDQDV